MKNGISSAPVFSQRLNCYVGMLDYRDIVDYVLLVFQKKTLEPISEEESLEIADIVEKAQSGVKVSAQAVSGNILIFIINQYVMLCFVFLCLLDLSHKNPFYSVMLESPLSSAIEILSSDNGVHRLNVVDGNGRVKGILSQTDIVNFLISKQDLFADLLNSTLNDLQIGCGPVISVNAEASVLEALEKMSSNFISSLAVVESDGTLIGNISMADIRFVFQYGRYHRLWMTCSQFIALALSQKGLEHGGNDQFPFFDAHIKSKLSQVMNKIVATKVHRVWVTDSKNQHLIGVVSLTDIIGLFYEKYFKVIDENDLEKEKNSQNDNFNEDY